MIKAAIIGVGYWGPNLLRNLMQHPGIEVKWLCDLDEKCMAKQQMLYPHIETTKDFKDIIKDPTIDLVVLSTPVHSHCSLGTAILKSKKHLLVTKPMAMNTLECEQLIEAAEKNKCVLMVDHTFVYHPAVRYLRDTVRSGELGKLLYYHSSRLNLGLYQPDVTVVEDLMPHDLSILAEITSEEPTEINVVVKNLAGLPKPDHAHVSLSYDSGFVAFVDVSWLSPSKVRLTTVTGTKKMIRYDDTDVANKIKVFDKGIEQVKYQNKEESYTKYIRYRHGSVFCPEIGTEEALAVEIRHLVECIESNKKPHTDGIAGLKVVKIIERASEIAQSSHCWVPFSELPKKVA